MFSKWLIIGNAVVFLRSFEQTFYGKMMYKVCLQNNLYKIGWHVSSLHINTFHDFKASMTVLKTLANAKNAHKFAFKKFKQIKNNCVQFGLVIIDTQYGG